MLSIQLGSKVAKIQELWHARYLDWPFVYVSVVCTQPNSIYFSFNWIFSKYTLETLKKKKKRRRVLIRCVLYSLKDDKQNELSLVLLLMTSLSSIWLDLWIWDSAALLWSLSQARDSDSSCWTWLAQSLSGLILFLFFFLIFKNHTCHYKEGRKDTRWRKTFVS